MVDLADLRCPVCAAPLTTGAQAFTCASGHSFDRARQGYVNLLRPTRLRGDTPEMLRARRRFLDAGWYAPLADALTESVSAWLTQDGAALPTVARTMLDAGCGEGYYLNALADALAPALAADHWRLYGLDLTKDAVRMAAARSRRVTWLVANSKDRLPFGDAGLGALLCVFAPRNPAEFARVLAPRGLLLVVTPTSEHLAEARAAIPWLLTPEPAKDERLRTTLDDAFALAETRIVSFPLALDADALSNLALMTPHRPVEPSVLQVAARAPAERSPDGRLTVRVSCVVRRYVRRGAPSA
ncbi:MAG TPA: methyltransferase domain-containing protein [Ktedonobacterales bacterium]|jgi:23S rRNA (guanine745-N1)-methyltransferase|nr:methyltransferase domain-containing protein [Ktedonobacterales bacterium]